MVSKTSILLVLLLISTIESYSAQNDTLPILLGQGNINTLLNSEHAEWFNNTYETYNVDYTFIDYIASSIADKRIMVFMGTWCEDSKEFVPPFIKIIDALKHRVEVDFVFVNKDKKDTKGLTDKYKIKLVPTIIVFDGKNKEVGRIVEKPTHSLEYDLSEILKY